MLSLKILCPSFSFFLILFACLIVGSQILLLSSIHILFCSVILQGLRVVFVFLLPLTSRSGLKPRVVFVPFFLCPGLFWAAYLPGPRACLFSFLSPRADPSKSSSQERAGATLSAGISSGS
uniref:Transmembrane protein n=1 Tax=Panthera tigris altaica TaxID=74533 RepID=A0A8C9M2M5_PANTA